jgi:N6-adenosine-specific RNA methylase IME4
LPSSPGTSMGKISEQAIELRLSKNVVPLTRSNLGPASTSRTGLDIPEDLPFEDWALLGDALSACEHTMMWWIGDWWAYGEQKYGERKKILEALIAGGHNPPAYKTCKNAGSLSRSFERSRRQDLLSWEHHAAVASLDKTEQDWMLDRAKAHGWATRQLRDEVRRYKIEQDRRTGTRKYETQTIVDLHALIESGKRFGTVYADPPWPYSNQGTRAATSNHYKEHNSLSVENICNLPVAKLLADNAHLHLWTTNGFLREAFDVMETWGVTYKSCYVWAKPDLGIGNYWRVSHEFLLFGIKGKAAFADNSLRSWNCWEPGEHSAKPAEIRRLIERVSPGPYLELFGRREVENWTIWGNEIRRITDATPLFKQGGQYDDQHILDSGDEA